MRKKKGVIQNGEMYWAAVPNITQIIPSFYYAKLEEDKYLTIHPSIFRKDPIKFRYAIVNEKKFSQLIEKMPLQGLSEEKK